VEEILEEETRLAPREWTGFQEILHEVCDKWGMQKKQLLDQTKIRSASRARREFFLRAHEEAGESMAALARLCGLAHTSVGEAIEKARKERHGRMSKNL
jgi:chromosomal replication initiation ATPase DnaA